MYRYPLNILSQAVKPFLRTINPCSSNHLTFLKSSPKRTILFDICTALLTEINPLKLIMFEFTVPEECISNHWLGQEPTSFKMHILASTKHTYHQENHSVFLDSVTTWCKYEFSHTSSLAVKFWLSKYEVILSRSTLISTWSCTFIPLLPNQLAPLWFKKKLDFKCVSALQLKPRHPDRFSCDYICWE